MYWSALKQVSISIWYNYSYSCSAYNIIICKYIICTFIVFLPCVQFLVDSPGCANGFMNMETMRTLLGLEEVGRLVGSARRQQITPDIRFKCDGMITKWIIGALWGNGLDDTLFPELQLWRNIGNDTYQKINGTFITVQTWSSNLIYEYDDFSPIPFQAGDILGAFIPIGPLSKLKLRSEGAHGPLNYYLRTTNSAEESPYDAIDLHESLSTGIYHPLITVEISKCRASFGF